MKVLAALLFCALPAVADEIPADADFICPQGSEVCTIRRTALIVLIKTRAPTRCDSRDS